MNPNQVFLTQFNMNKLFSFIISKYYQVTSEVTIRSQLVQRKNQIIVKQQKKPNKLEKTNKIMIQKDKLMIDIKQ